MYKRQVCFLIVPGIRKNANTDAASQLVKANETIATREQSIKSLEDEISSLQPVSYTHLDVYKRQRETWCVILVSIS